MDELPVDLKEFLDNHPFFELTDGKKLKCTLNGHELPCNLTELQKFTTGKKYKKLASEAEFNYSQYEPHIVPSTKQPNHFFCKLTLRHLNRQPRHILKHVNGKRFKKALAKYEECEKQGIKFVPQSQKQKKFEDTREDSYHGMSKKHTNGMWEPSSGDEGDSDSGDSMSDLYPPCMFTLKNPVEEAMDLKGGKHEDDFITDEDEAMETEVVQKRKKVQSGGFQKKHKNNRWKPGRKKQRITQNGK